VTKRLYLAGPMTGYSDLNFPLFHAETARLRALGFDVVNPAEINVDPSKGWAECLKADIAQLVTCDGIALLPEWNRSKGATFEHHIAETLGLDIRNAHEIVEAE
jgi:nucleoside 2-deoxyribosyltransferase